MGLLGPIDSSTNNMVSANNVRISQGVKRADFANIVPDQDIIPGLSRYIDTVFKQAENLTGPDRNKFLLQNLNFLKAVFKSDNSRRDFVSFLSRCSDDTVKDFLKFIDKAGTAKVISFIGTALESLQGLDSKEIFSRFITNALTSGKLTSTDIERYFHNLKETLSDAEKETETVKKGPGEKRKPGMEKIRKGLGERLKKDFGIDNAEDLNRFLPWLGAQRDRGTIKSEDYRIMVDDFKHTVDNYTSILETCVQYGVEGAAEELESIKPIKAQVDNIWESLNPVPVENNVEMKTGSGTGTVFSAAKTGINEAINIVREHIKKDAEALSVLLQTYKDTKALDKLKESLKSLNKALDELTFSTLEESKKTGGKINEKRINAIKTKLASLMTQLQTQIKSVNDKYPDNPKAQEAVQRLEQLLKISQNIMSILDNTLKAVDEKDVPDKDTRIALFQEQAKLLAGVQAEIKAIFKNMEGLADVEKMLKPITTYLAAVSALLNAELKKIHKEEKTVLDKEQKLNEEAVLAAMKVQGIKPTAEVRDIFLDMVKSRGGLKGALEMIKKLDLFAKVIEDKLKKVYRVINSDNPDVNELKDLLDDPSIPAETKQLLKRFAVIKLAQMLMKDPKNVKMLALVKGAGLETEVSKELASKGADKTLLAQLSPAQTQV